MNNANRKIENDNQDNTDINLCKTTAKGFKINLDVYHIFEFMLDLLQRKKIMRIIHNCHHHNHAQKNIFYFTNYKKKSISRSYSFQRVSDDGLLFSFIWMFEEKWINNHLRRFRILPIRKKIQWNFIIPTNPCTGWKTREWRWGTVKWTTATKMKHYYL